MKILCKLAETKRNIAQMIRILNRHKRLTAQRLFLSYVKYTSPITNIIKTKHFMSNVKLKIYH